jgi:hypothetical protein
LNWLLPSIASTTVLDAHPCEKHSEMMRTEHSTCEQHSYGIYGVSRWCICEQHGQEEAGSINRMQWLLIALPRLYKTQHLTCEQHGQRPDCARACCVYEPVNPRTVEMMQLLKGVCEADTGRGEEEVWEGGMVWWWVYGRCIYGEFMAYLHSPVSPTCLRPPLRPCPRPHTPSEEPPGHRGLRGGG